MIIQIIGIRGRCVEIGQERLHVSRSEWLNIIPKVAEKLAHSGITVVYPKVFLNTDEPFECAGLVAENYFTISPPQKIHEVMAQYAEQHITD